MNVVIIKILLFLLSTNPAYKSSVTFTENKCAECHADYATNKVNHPAAESCDNCHQPNGKEHPAPGEKCFTLAQAVPALCYNCHEPKNTKTTKHAPVDGGECMTCHSAHSSTNKSLLADFPASNLCVMCHEISTENKKSVHKPVTEKKCTNCHDPHQSDFARLLKKDSKELCLSCHKKTYKSGDKTVANIGLMIKTGNNVHGAIEGDGCVTCHKGHFSENSNLLTDKFPEGNYSYGGKDSYSLCFTCHDSQMMETEKTTTVTGFRNGDRNLHFVHVGTTKSRSCTNCHNVHGSPNLHLINTEAGFGSVTVRLNYKTTENGGGCLPACHQELKYDRIKAIEKEKIMTVAEKNSLDSAKRAEQKAAMQAELRKMEEDMVNAKKADEEAKLKAENNKQEIIALNNERKDTTSETSKQEEQIVKITEQNNIEAENKTSEQKQSELVEKQEETVLVTEKITEGTQKEETSLITVEKEENKAVLEEKEAVNVEKVKQEAEFGEVIHPELTEKKEENIVVTESTEKSETEKSTEISNEEKTESTESTEQINEKETVETTVVTETITNELTTEKVQTEESKNEEKINETSVAENNESEQIVEPNENVVEEKEAISQNTVQETESVTEEKIEIKENEKQTVEKSVNSVEEKEKTQSVVKSDKEFESALNNVKSENEVKEASEKKSNETVTDNKEQKKNALTNVEEEDDDENEESEIIKLNSVKFEFDSATFNPAFEKELNSVARQLQKNPKWKVEIQGYTDNVGSEWYNLALSYRRAKTAKILLMNRGISDNRISIVGYGESKPIKSNDTEKGRLLNRRIEFKFIYK